MTSITEAWINTGKDLENLAENPDSSPFSGEWQTVRNRARAENGWFVEESVDTALRGIIRLLNETSLKSWTGHYPALNKTSGLSLKTGVIMAGNIPMAGFHDMLCVSLSGHSLYAKLSSDDAVLLPFLNSVFSTHHPEAAGRIQFVSNLKNMDAVIATGSNNTSRYFEYYFGKLPHLFRKNRNSVAVLDGTENEFDLLLLGRDIFTYYGLGCRNVSKLYVPEGYNFDAFFNAMQKYQPIMDHNKYMNNYDYNRSVYLLNLVPFLTNNFLILMEKEGLATPVSVLHYEFYRDTLDLEAKLQQSAEGIQCVVRKKGPVNFGQAQFPEVDDYADGVDTLRFLLSLN